MMIAITVIMLIVMVITAIKAIITMRLMIAITVLMVTMIMIIIRRTRIIGKITMKIKENYKKRTRKYETQKEERDYMLRKAGKK